MKFLAEEPQVDDGVMIMLRAYVEVSSCRSVGFGLGPIPWTAMVDWCVWHRLERDVANHVIKVLRLVDQETLRRQAADNRAKAPKPRE